MARNDEAAEMPRSLNKDTTNDFDDKTVPPEYRSIGEDQHTLRNCNRKIIVICIV
jgi:hypothetical protein